MNLGKVDSIIYLNINEDTLQDIYYAHTYSQTYK
jgi:hypothetical protein